MLAALEEALPTGAPAPPRLARTRPKTRRQSLLTLLFLPVVGLRRTCDLRHYTGDALALLTGRRRAYGFWWGERFLSEVARAGGAEALTDALAAWTAKLWLPDTTAPDDPVPAFYVDGHKKPVYSDHLIPRGLIGRTGKVLGCRALVLLHDAAGHPLLATTHRGDLPLKEGVPPLVTRYERAAADAHLLRLVVDREGMAAEWLAELAAQGRTVVTLLRADQYQGLASFSEVGPFVPWRCDRQGRVTREVASARYSLPLPDHPGQRLPLWVALVRDWTRQVPVPASKAAQASRPRWDADLAWKANWWWDADWVATPSPAPPTEPKLIPIVTTAPLGDAIALAETYTHRWPAQENSFRDWLLAVGLDTNYGYRSDPIENSEVSKRRVALQGRLDRLQRWAQRARERTDRASRLYTRRGPETKTHADQLYRRLTDHQQELLRQGVDRDEVRATIRQEQHAADAEIAAYEQRQWHAYDTSNAEFRKCERYCRLQREVLRALEDLAASERTMYELDQRKDQVMTAFKLALVNLVMWVRQQYFPAAYAQATWHRLEPFFRLPGRVTWGTDAVEVEVRPFNDRRLAGDLAALCTQVQAAQPRLSDGRFFQIASTRAAASPSLRPLGAPSPEDQHGGPEANQQEKPRPRRLKVSNSYQDQDQEQGEPKPEQTDSRLLGRTGIRLSQSPDRRRAEQ